MLEHGGVASLDRGLQILAAFAPEDDQLSLADLARRTGFYKSTILRLLATLEHRLYVTRLPSGAYRLGPSGLHLGMVYQRSFRLEDDVIPVMEAISKRTRESVSFYTHEDDNRVCLFRIDSPLSVRENHARVGHVAPATRGPGGRVYAAFRDGVQHAQPKDFAALPSIDVGETFADVAAAAAPAFGFDGKLVGLLMVSGPKERFTRTALGVISVALLDAARDLTAKLGGDPSVFALARPGRAVLRPVTTR